MEESRVWGSPGNCFMLVWLFLNFFTRKQPGEAPLPVRMAAGSRGAAPDPNPPPGSPGITPFLWGRLVLGARGGIVGNACG